MDHLGFGITRNTIPTYFTVVFFFLLWVCVKKRSFVHRTNGFQEEESH